MHVLRWFALAALVGVVVALPSAAAADVGAYIDLDRTHYLPGQTAVGLTYVSVPENKQDLFQRGPFYAFVVSEGSSLRESRPIPDGVIRVGTFSIQREKGTSFELRASMTVPDLPGDFYSIAFCNDPCTITGFREPLTGVISIVQTSREGQLLTEQSRLEGRVFGLRRDARKAERAGEELRAQLDVSEAERSRLSSEVSRLEEALAATPSTILQPSKARPLIGLWVGGLIAIALFALAGTLAIRRRRPAPIVVPDTIEELEREAERPATR